MMGTGLKGPTSEKLSGLEHRIHNPEVGSSSLPSDIPLMWGSWDNIQPDVFGFKRASFGQALRAGSLIKGLSAAPPARRISKWR